MRQRFKNKEERRLVKNQRMKVYYQLNKEKIKTKSKKYRQENKEKVKISQKIKYEKTKKRIRKKESEYRKNRTKTDINFKLLINLRGRLGKSISGNYKSGSAVQDLGCSIPELKRRLESMFQPGMSWDNWSKTGWHIDHIIPLDSFNLQNREDFLKACHYTNLQPLWAEENLKKGNKIVNL